MCLVIYIASDKTIPIVNMVSDGIGFYIREIEGHENDVYQHFTKRLVYYLGSAEGCSCGFIMDGIYPDMDEYAETRESYHLLSKFIQEEIKGSHLEIYSCWIAEETTKPKEFHEINSRDIGETYFEFEDNHFYKVNNF